MTLTDAGKNTDKSDHSINLPIIHSLNDFYQLNIKYQFLSC